MKKPSLTKSYNKLSDADLDLKCDAISLSLDTNTSFPNLTPTLAEFNSLRLEFKAALDDSRDGARTPIARKNQLRTLLLDMLKKMAMSIEAHALNDRSKLLSSGFDLVQEADGSPLAAPANFKIENGINDGEIVLSVEAVRNAVSYLHEYTEDPLTPDSKWIQKPSSKRKHQFTGLPSGKRIHARIIVVGHRGQQTYTPILSRMVQ